MIGADALVQYLDPEDRRTAGLFGDGAGAVVMSAREPPGHIASPVLRADGSQADAIYARQDERKVRMQGQDTVGERLDLSEEKVVDCIKCFANTSAASIPIALAQADEAGMLREGQRLLLAAFGAGFTWGGVVVDWGLET